MHLTKQNDKLDTRHPKWRCWSKLALMALPVLLFAGDPPDQPQDQSSAPVVSGPRIRVLDLAWDTRFNYMDRQRGPVTDRGLQYRFQSRVRLDARKDGSTYFVVRAETGKGFDNSWNNTGLGLGRGQSIFNVKSVAVHHRIGDRLEAEAGGLDFNHGAGTDAIYASNDGHMSGYRALFQPRTDALPEKISLTAGYVGDFDKPNFFSRIRMDRINYIQLLAEQSFGEQIHTSADVDSIHDVVFVRGAVSYGPVWVFDNATLEAIGRTTDRFRFGWSSSLDRRWGSASRWRTDLIYADVPYELFMVGGQRVLLNRGEIDVGKRLALGTVYRISQDCEAGVFAGRLLDSTPSKRWIAQAGVRYQFAGLVNRFLP